LDFTSPLPLASVEPLAAVLAGALLSVACWLFSDVGAANTACPDFSGALTGSDFAAGAIFSGGAFCCAAGGAAGVSSFFMPCAETAPAPSSIIAAVVDINRRALMDVSFGHSAIV
jgi:hypothetical protein